MRAPEFEAMIAPARLYPEIWRILLGLLIVVFCYAAVIALGLVAIFAAFGPLEFFGRVQELARPVTPEATLMVLVSFLGMFLGTLLAAAAAHARGPGTLVGPWGEFWRGVLDVLKVTVPLYAVLLAIGFRLEAPVENLPWRVWAGWLPFALPLIALQVSAEELLFRGYLQQQLAARFRHRAVWMGLPSLLFALLHINPEAGGAALLIILTTFVFALIAADLTERTGSLGPAIALHFVNNVYGLTVISMSGTITGLSRWTTAYGLGEQGPVAVSLGFNIVFLIVLWRLLRWVLDR